jgi:dTDP-4-amino-4,6-dideoxygalactose transaminase
VLEDAAQAHGARYKGTRLGGHGDAVAWSFYPSQNLGAGGDAGAVTTCDPQIADRVRMLGNYGSRTRYVNEVPGVNSRLDPLHAAILCAKLPYLDSWNERRSAIAACYGERLSDCGLSLPYVPNWASPVWHLYVVRSPRREEVQTFLSDAGVQTLVHYPIPPHLQQAYSGLNIPKGSLPIAEQLADEVLSLPIGPHLAPEQADMVIAAVRQWHDR